MPTAPGASPGSTAGNYFISNYPPYSCWTAKQNRVFERALNQPASPGPLALYVHLPFCRQRCRYCYFRVYPAPLPERVDRYIQTVLEELALYGRRAAVSGRPIVSAYFGGGTPSYLSEAQVERLLSGLQAEISWAGLQECTFECEPGTVSLHKLIRLRELGVTRVSLGFQTLTEEVLQRVGRLTGVRDALEAFRLARQAGFAEINVDLIAGLPRETPASWRRTVEQVAALRPGCITIYQLELTHNSGLYALLQAGLSMPLVSWEEKRAAVDEAFRMLEASGYTVASGYMAVRAPASWRFVYTVEHYWQGAELLALGESAFGLLQGFHYQNADEYEDYVARVRQGRLPLRRALRLGGEERLRREVILLLKTGQLDCAYFRRRFGVELGEKFAPEFERLRGQGFLEFENDRVRLTRKGLLQVDALLPAFYLPAHAGVRYT